MEQVIDALQQCNHDVGKAAMLLVKAEAARVDTPHPPPQRPVASPLPPATEAPSSASTPPAKPRSANKTSTADRRSTKRQRKRWQQEQDTARFIQQYNHKVRRPFSLLALSHCKAAQEAALATYDDIVQQAMKNQASLTVPKTQRRESQRGYSHLTHLSALRRALAVFHSIAGCLGAHIAATVGSLQEE